MSLRESKATTPARGSRPSRRSTLGSFMPATTCAAVTTRFGAATQPRARDPEPARSAEDANDAGAAARTPGLPSSAGFGGADVRPGAARSTGNGSTRCDRVDQPRRRHELVDPPRMRERWTSSRSSVWPGRWSATAPSTQTSASAGGGAEREPAERSRARAAAAARTRPGSRARTTPTRLEQDRADGRAAERDERRVRRVAPPSRLGASRAPMTAPTAIPASESASRRARSAARGTRRAR